MKIVRNPHTASRTPLALTIGNFDGVHLGHRHLIDQVCRCRRESAAPIQAAAMTFEPHPLAVLRPEQPLQRLGGRRDKLSLLKQSGLDMLYILRFNKQLADMSADAFADLLFSRLAVRHLFIGENFRFGRGAGGDVALLKKTAAAAGATVTAAPLFSLDNQPVSSGRVRHCLQNGDFATAARLLGRPWRLCGRIIRGDQRGRELGFPTANVQVHFIPPLRGIFAARAYIDGESLAAAVSIGVNPTVCTHDTVKVEAHLLDFDRRIYGAVIQVELLHKLRDEYQYDSLAALTSAIADDVTRTRALML